MPFPCPRILPNLLLVYVTCYTFAHRHSNVLHRSCCMPFPLQEAPAVLALLATLACIFCPTAASPLHCLLYRSCWTPFPLRPRPAVLAWLATRLECWPW